MLEHRIDLARVIAVEDMIAKLTRIILLVVFL